MQRTISGVVEISGTGLHTGNDVHLRLKPAEPSTGVVFIRTDLPGAPRVPAHIDCFIDYPRRTSLRRREAEVQTVEHFLATLMGLGIDNLEVELDSPEMPALDGSSLEFYKLLKSAGVIDQPKAPKNLFVLKEPITITEDSASIVALPSENGQLVVSYTLDYDQSFLPPQHMALHINENTFEKDLAPARTFCLEDEAEELLRAGLGRGASTENTLVVGMDGVKDNELRFENEFVRHKVTDLLGDLYLAGVDIVAHIVALRSGHNLNIQLVENIVDAIEARERAKERSLAGATEMDIRQIQKILPHRYPFIMIDKIIELEPNRRAVAIKNVTFNEHFFQGHFPGQPVMPAVLQIEAMAQVGGMLLLKKMENINKLAFILSVDKVKFRKTVVPGDQLVIEAVAIRVKSRTGEVRAHAKVDGKVVSEAIIRFMLVDTV
jgi:UDP-3-O-[3-hydroxymyristoyl] N-acetylglucosamine deacetylase/3-hydroxyacyl-[acyl-carrier-protein] dehydratase